MKYFFISDLHVDFYAPLSRNVSTLRKYFEPFFERNFLPADACCIAGDIANDYFTYVEFLKFIAEKYNYVYVCLGNHDIIMELDGRFGVDREFKTSEEKIAYFITEADKIQNVMLLENRIADGIAGCMGMCDFKCEAPTYGLDAFTAWKRNWYDGKHWRYFRQEPGLIWNHYDKVMTDIVKQKPKVMITHFVPYELGVAFDFRNDPWNYVFYFKAEKFLEELDDDTYWICGHTHGRRRAEWVNSKGNKIHIICNPLGYPGDKSEYCDILDYTGDEIDMTNIPLKNTDFILNL
jgi:Icc-related predicted phosphoesterase